MARTKHLPYYLKPEMVTYKPVKIYFIVCQETMRVKIGITEKDIGHRLKALQTGSPTELKLVSYEIGDKGYEKRLHDNFSKYHRHGEWFYMSDEILDYIVEKCHYKNSQLVAYMKYRLDTHLISNDFKCACKECRKTWNVKVSS